MASRRTRCQENKSTSSAIHVPQNNCHKYTRHTLEVIHGYVIIRHELLTAWKRLSFFSAPTSSHDDVPQTPAPSLRKHGPLNPAAPAPRRCQGSPHALRIRLDPLQPAGLCQRRLRLLHQPAAGHHVCQRSACLDGRLVGDHRGGLFDGALRCDFRMVSGFCVCWLVGIYQDCCIVHCMSGWSFAGDSLVAADTNYQMMQCHFPRNHTEPSRTSLSSFSAQPLTILGVTGPFSILAENIYSLCATSFDVSEPLIQDVLPQD